MGCSRSARWSASCVRVAFSITSFSPLHTPCTREAHTQRARLAGSAARDAVRVAAAERAPPWSSGPPPAPASRGSPMQPPPSGPHLARGGGGGGHALPQNGDDLGQDAIAHLAHLGIAASRRVLSSAASRSRLRFGSKLTAQPASGAQWLPPRRAVGRSPPLPRPPRPALLPPRLAHRPASPARPGTAPPSAGGPRLRRAAERRAAMRSATQRAAA